MDINQLTKKQLCSLRFTGERKYLQVLSLIPSFNIVEWLIEITAGWFRTLYAAVTLQLLSCCDVCAVVWGSSSLNPVYWRPLETLRLWAKAGWGRSAPGELSPGSLFFFSSPLSVLREKHHSWSCINYISCGSCLVWMAAVWSRDCLAFVVCAQNVKIWQFNEDRRPQVFCSAQGSQRKWKWGSKTKR